MFRFLIVEDNYDTLAQLTEIVREVFPDCVVDMATNIKKGLEHIERARMSGAGYDAAILDFKLPKDVGVDVQADTSLCDSIRRVTPDVPVIHITAYVEDTVLFDHIRKAHQAPGDSRFILISKNDSEWGTKLITELQRHLYTTRVTNAMDDIFGSEQPSVSGQRRLTRGGHLTHKLAALLAELAEHWEKLDPRLQERVLRHFRRSPKESGGKFTLVLPISKDES